MRMIVEAFADTLELGLAKPNQIVVRARSTLPRSFSLFPYPFRCLVFW